jgi:ribosome-associated translation inhibitor RaiA
MRLADGRQSPASARRWIRSDQDEVHFDLDDGGSIPHTQMGRVQPERANCMTTLVEIHFHGIEKSDAVEQRVRDKVAKLQTHFERMISCRVTIEATQRNPQKPKVYQIKIEIGIPRRKPVVVVHERVGSHASEELGLAIRDAFEAALRKVDGIAARVTQRAKLERGRRRPRQVEQSVRAGVSPGAGPGARGRMPEEA